MTRSRLTLGQVVALAERLSERDLAVVASLGRVRLLTGRQLERLHFDGEQPTTRARRRRRVLERLVEAGVLSRLERRIGGVRAGSAGFLYALGPAGQRLVGRQGPGGGRRYRQPWTPSPPFVAHVLAVAELYTSLTEAARSDTVELLEFSAEPACWRRFTGPLGIAEVLKPDGFVRTGLGEFEEMRFVEVDLGTESPSTLDRKLTAYRRYWASGQEQHRHGVFPGVLLLVPDQRRHAVVVDACGRQPANAWPLFQVALLADAVAVFTGSRT